MRIELECDGIERSPNPCVCMCEGCTHHCGAHDPSRIAEKFLCRNLGGNGATCPGCRWVALHKQIEAEMRSNHV